MKKIIPFLLIINDSCFIISLAISFVILFRPFYYWHIDMFDLPEKTGFTYNEIKESYDDVLDYTVYHQPFSTGVFKYSSDGMDHFKDCKTLFTINFILLIISFSIILLKRKWFNNIKLFNHNISFFSGLLNIFLLGIIIIVSLINFDFLFTAFHKILFLNKDNWLFDSSKDEIIKILPQRFFMNCGILIISIIGIISIVIVVRELFVRKTALKLKLINN